ncbi:MAG: OmpA family protein [Spirosoma sp.]|nr:OmpA family protein [Spirosoma sp.]
MPHQRTGCIIALLCLLSAAGIAQIRINDPTKSVQRSLESRTSSKVNQTLDRNTSRTLDKAEKDIDKAAKKKKKDKKKDKKDADVPADSDVAVGTPESEPAPAETKRQKRQRTDKSEKPAKDVPSVRSEPVSMRSYSLFDFVPASTVVALDDFGADAMGSYPSRWNTTTKGGIVTLDKQPAKWLAITQDGLLAPEYLSVLPDYFTLELDMAVTDRVGNAGTGVALRFIDSKASPNLLQPSHAAEVRLTLQPGAETTTLTAWTPSQTERMANRNALRNWNGTTLPKARLSIWRQGSRLRAYVNEVKIWDVPLAFVPGSAYRLLLERDFVNADKQVWCIGNMRVSVGVPYVKSKYNTEGQFSTTGIVFADGTDQILPESYGVLKEISTVLTSNVKSRVRIIGHTDSDGKEDKNLDLSKRRAAAVRAMLTTEFGIDAGRMDTDGKGASQPTTNNATPEGKANNRRVEFVKL